MKIGLRFLKPFTAHSELSLCCRHISPAFAAKSSCRFLLGVSVLTVATVRRLCEDGQLEKAIQAAEELHCEEFAASTDMLYLLLQGCINDKDLASGRRVQQLIIDCGFLKNPFLGSHLIRMFASCGALKEANDVFEKLPKHTVFTWNALITACAVHGNAIEAINMYQAMQLSDVAPDQHIFVNALKACAKAECLNEGRLIHYQIMVSIFKPNAYVNNALIDMYVKCISLEDALFVFETLSSKDVVTWTTIIVGYGEHDHGLEAIRFFQQMQCEGIAANGITYIGILKACSNAFLHNQGIFFHACLCKSEVKLDLPLANTLIAMYGKSRRLKDAVDMLNQMPKQDIVTWNVLIAAHVQHGSVYDALLMYDKMQKQGLEPDEVTFLSITQACSYIGDLAKGRIIHRDIVCCGIESVILVNNALIGMYGKCGSVKDAFAVFRSFSEHNVFTWNTLIAGYIQQREYSEVFKAYTQMQEDGLEADSITFVSLLQACSLMTSLLVGMLIHACIIMTGIRVDFYLHSCLIEMYNECESFEDAHHLLAKSQQKGMTFWDSMFTNGKFCGQNKDMANIVLQESIAACSIRFPKLLKACSCLNALDLGRRIHCNAVEVLLDLDVHIGNALIDMYAKCGSTEDAYSVLSKMSKRDAVTWTTLISGCGHYMDYQFAMQCYEKMVNEGVNPVETTYVCLLTACSRAGQWKEGCRFFESMIKQSALSLTPDHYYCMVDLFGRSGRLTEAEDMLQTVPLSRPGVVGHRTLLNHRRLHTNEELGI